VIILTLYLLMAAIKLLFLLFYEEYTMKKLLAAIIALTALSPIANAQMQMPVYQIAFKDHKIVPDQLIVPAGTPFKIIVTNMDPTREEFESDDMGILEKFVEGNSKIEVDVNALKPGKFRIFGEMNENTAQGVIIAQ
jgi:Cupredoxin-like domain